MTDLLSFLAPRIVFSVSLVEQYRFPRSKKKRIRAKWAKRDGNWRPLTKVLMDRETGTIYAHPTMEPHLRGAASSLS
jgi:hypothetical protein